RNGGTRVMALDDSSSPDQQNFKRIDPAPPAAAPGGSDASAQSLAASLRSKATAAQLMSKHKNGAPKSTALADAADAPAVAAPAMPPGLKDAEYADEVGDDPAPEREATDTSAAVPLTTQAMFMIIRQVAPRHSGDV